MRGIIGTILGCAMLVACADVQSPDPFDSSPLRLENLNYQDDILAFLQDGCVSCHGPQNAEGDYDLSSYPGVLGSGSDAVPNVIPGDPNSLLLQTVTISTQPATHAVSAAEFTRLRNWIVDDRLALRRPVVHPAGYVDERSAAFHGAALAKEGWDMAPCRVCHGEDYAGGAVDRACTLCHVATPEGCNTCHGDFVTGRGAPPEDLAGNTATTERGVGAHASHVTGGGIAAPVACETCHVVPGAYRDAGHLDSALPAEVALRGLAGAEGAVPVWDAATLSCSGTYCHGNFIVGEKNNTPRWTVVDGTQAACGTCHALPPAGVTESGFDHPDRVTDCSICHPSVVSAGNVITSPELHVNGIINR